MNHTSAPAQDSTALAAALARGDRRALSRMLSRIDRRDPAAVAALYAAQSVSPDAPVTAQVIGITGAPGAGKSTLIGQLGLEYRRRNRRVAVLAVDPSSALSQGAILADRLRMGELATDPTVFIRSMATRGAQGGLSEASFDAIVALELAGFDTVIVETVGVGQDEIDIAYMADTTVVVSVPGLGDAVQAIKAGLLEMADVHAVNKSDRPEAHRTVTDLKTMLAIVGKGAGHVRAGAWDIPVLAVSAETRTGLAELADALDAHRDFLAAAGNPPRRTQFLERRLWQALRELCETRVRSRIAEPALQGMLAEVLARRRSPQEAAAALLHGIGLV